MVQLKDPEKNEVSNGSVGRVSASGLGQWGWDQRVEWRNEGWPPIPRINALLLESLGIRKDRTA